jgi:hypothetical protein
MIRKHAQDAVLAVFETGRSQLGFVANSPPMAACIGAHAKAAPGTAPNKTGANGADRLFWSAASLRPRIFHCKTSNADRAAERTVNPGGCLLREEGLAIIVMPASSLDGRLAGGKPRASRARLRRLRTCRRRSRHP